MCVARERVPLDATRQSDGTFAFSQTLIHSTSGDGGNIGASVGITPDGLTIFLGAPYFGTNGAVFVFRATSTSGPWSEDATALVPAGASPYSVVGWALAATATTLVIGAPQGVSNGGVFVYHRQASGAYVEDSSNPLVSGTPNDYLGSTVRLRCSSRWRSSRFGR